MHLSEVFFTHFMQLGKTPNRKVQRAKELKEEPEKESKMKSKAEEAKSLVTKALATRYDEVLKQFYCARCDRACYIKYNGEHALYTHENITAHARLLVSFLLIIGLDG